MKIKINVPNGISGDWKVDEFVITKEIAKSQRMRAIFQNGRGVMVEGTYKRLIRNGTTVMSNTPDEIRDLIWFISGAKGSILVNGLGLGVLLKGLLAKKEITDITVIEKSKDVIKLVAPTYLKDNRVQIINADAFTYQPPKGKRFDCVWHDIWDNICSDNLPEMAKLHRKYGKRTSYQDSWCKYLCKR